jgi:exoribonuclease R
MLYKITVTDRNYKKWVVTEVKDQNVTLNIDIVPETHKLFSNDIFEYNAESGNVNIIHSSIRNVDNIPAVLVLTGNKTYGRHPNNNKLLYKCIPDDMSLPPFLVPYEIKNMGFSKVFVNQYVTIQFTNWDSKHPVGVLASTIGPVSEPENFYEYQMFCKGLNISLTKFSKSLNSSLLKMAVNKESFTKDLLSSKDKNSQIDDRTEWQVFTIDPEGSLDFDDAFSIKVLDNGNTFVSIYIAHAPLCLDRLNLWSNLTKRTSTIYLPDKKRPMLPPLLSDCLCSLQSGAPRFAFTLDIEINPTGEIVHKTFCNTIIKVFKNFVYEERSLIRHPLYKSLLDVVLQMVTKHPYIKHIGDSHDIVCYLMILMNHLAAQEMCKNQVGIFRATSERATSERETLNVLPSNDLPTDILPTDVLPTDVLPTDVLPTDVLPTDVLQFINIWQTTSGKYININQDSATRTTHSILGLDSYIHITSPIRRLVDILNMIKFQELIGFKLSDAALEFYNQWIKEMDYINNSMKMTKRVQNDCNLLHMCHVDPNILDKTFDGYCFDEKGYQNDLFKYNVYLPELKTTGIVICTKITQYSKQKFRLFVFNNEEKMKKKIRLQLV